MNIKEFYLFGSKFVSSTVQVHPLNLSFEKDENQFDDILRLAIGKYQNITFPVVFKQEYGKKLQDILDTGTVSLFLISDKMKTILEDNNFTGWKTFAVKVLDKKGQEMQGYHGLSITGRCGEIDYSKSEIIKKRFVLPDGPLDKFYKGLHVGLDKWDGSDFFLPEKYFGTIITSRVAEILKKNKFTNVRLENLAEMEILAWAIEK
jgi:hypothetical protein